MKHIIIALLWITTHLAVANDTSVDCNQATTTMQTNQCAAIELKDAKLKMQYYYQTSLKHNDHDTLLIQAIQRSQVTWEQYLTDHCDSVYTQWRDGTIRGVMSMTCKTTLTHQRTFQLWHDFLTFVDNSEPVLPKPVR